MPEINQPAGTPAAPAAPLPNNAVGTSTGQPIVAEPAAPPAAPAAPAAPPAAPAAPAAKRTIQMSQDDFNERLTRAKKKTLIDIFGTDDVAAIKAAQAEAKALREEKEKNRLAQMSEIDRAKAVAKKAQDEALRYRNELAAMQEREIVREQQSVVQRIAERYIDPTMVEDAAFIFGKYLRDNVPEEKLAKWTERDIASWFQNYAKKKPAYARKPGTGAPRRVERQPAGSAQPAPAPRTPSSTQTNGVKDLRPGGPNSLSRAEARQEAAKLGYRW